MRRHLGLWGAIALSLALHLALVWPWLTPDLAGNEQEPLELRLVAQPDDAPARSDPASSVPPRPASQPQHQAPSGVLSESALGSSSVHDADLLARLRQIQRRIAPHWERADPPGPGQVVVQVQVDVQGRVQDVRIPLRTGPASLERVVRDVVARGAPYAEAMRGATAPVWVECEFRTGSTDPSRTGTTPDNSPSPVSGNG
ncbi:hypothetical protein [Desulfohalobium retbaense]|uniref:hypothetical protein n=1 Tax=Desulfohalobium retbaense TaxID=45663 RepID=UPI00059D5EAB|nr:hypothetical protein [Desulfohalobium retbaense]